MRIVPTGRGQQVVEVPEVNRCAGCQGILATPHVTIGWLSCDCAGGRGHRWFHCLDCGTFTYDPTHDETITSVVGGSDYFNG
jgi:hypothetical protein